MFDVMTPFNLEADGVLERRQTGVSGTGADPAVEQCREVFDEITVGFTASRDMPLPAKGVAAVGHKVARGTLRDLHRLGDLEWSRLWCPRRRRKRSRHTLLQLSHQHRNHCWC